MFNETLSNKLKNKDNGMDLSEKKEYIYEAYTRTYDIGLSMKSVPLNDYEKKKLKEDIDFQDRIAMSEIEAKQKLIDDLKDMTNPSKIKSDSTRLKALELLGKIVYPERFDETMKRQNNDDAPQVNIYLPDNNREEKEEE